MNAITITTRIAVITAALVILSAGILGYSALFDLFVSIGLFNWWLAIFFPLLFDLAEVTAAVSVFNAKLQGEDDKFAWGMVILFTILGIVANIGHATAAWWTGHIDTIQVILAIFATSLFPLSVALVTHLVKRVIARDITRRATVSSLAELLEMVSYRQAELSQLDKMIKDKRAKLDKITMTNDHLSMPDDHLSSTLDKANEVKLSRVTERRQEVLSLLQSGLSPDDISGQMGVSVRTIKRDILSLNGQVGVTA